MADPGRSVGHFGLVALAVELADVRAPLEHLFYRRVYLLGIGGVDGVAEVHEPAADYLADVVQQRDPTLERRVSEHRPGVDVDAFRHLGLQVGESGIGDGVGNAPGERGVDDLLGERRVEVALDVRYLRLVKLLDHALACHRRDLVGARCNDVVAGAAGLELGVHSLVGVEGVDDHLHPQRLLERALHVGRKVVAPGIDVEFLPLHRLEVAAGRLRRRNRLGGEVGPLL